jgi:uncharacterized hydrophobic protein (TIGR00271 family)
VTEKTSRPQPITFRRSHQLRPSGVLLLDVGLWLVIGVFGLYDAVLDLSGADAGWAYLATGLLLIPTLLSHVELRTWIGFSGGSYRPIRAMERPQVTFLAGWTYVLGWAALSALVARLFARYAGDLVGLVTPWQLDETVLAAGMVFIFILANVLGYRPAWRLSVRVIGSAIVAVVALAVVLLARTVGASGPTSPAAPEGGHFFTAVAALAAGAWSADITSEVRSRRQKARDALLGSLAGPALGGILAMAGLWTTAPAAPLRTLVVEMLPIGEPLLAGFGTLVTAIAWQMMALLMLRRFHSIGRDGLFPEQLIFRYTRFRTPVFLILIQGALALVAIFVGSILDLAHLAAFAFLLLQIGVNVAAIALAKSPHAGDRGLFLPLYPVIPASGAAISFLLLVAVPLWPMGLLGLGWLAIGLLLYWQFGRNRIRTSQLGVTVFQDTTRRPDVTSDYPVVVPIANPDTAMNLVAFGAEAARHHGGHLAIVQVIVVPEQLPLDSARYQAQQKLDLLERVLQEAERYDVRVEGITRLSRSVAQGIIDTMAEESARLCIMGWNARPRSPGRRGLGHVLDQVIESATCDIAIVRGGWDRRLSRVLVPASTGPHAPCAAELALALTSDTGGKVTLLNVARPDDGEESLLRRRALLDGLREKLTEPARVATRVTAADSPLAGILDAAEDQDAILMGISEPGFLEQPVVSQLPVQLAHQTERPLALIRNYAGLTSLVARKAWQSLADILPSLDVEEQMQVYRAMQRAARPNINYFVLIALSALIATLGLLLNSPAVIIGAMLVAPLMSPIVATATGIVFGDVRTLRDALSSTVQGVLAAVFIATLASLVTPLADATPEVLARTRPTLLDLMVALFSGMAGAYAIARKEVGEALPGVAIAAALMPPVCTIGIGIALGQVGVALGALLLFTANLVAIIFSSVVVFLLLGIRPPRSPDRQRQLRRGLLISIASLLVISLPLGGVLFRAVEQDRIESQAREIVREATAGWEDARLVDFDVEYGWREVTITGTLYTTGDVTDDDLQALEEEVTAAAFRQAVHVRLFVVKGTLLEGEAP